MCVQKVVLLTGCIELFLYVPEQGLSMPDSLIMHISYPSLDCHYHRYLYTYCGSYAFLFPLLVALLTCLIYLPQAEGLYCLKSVSVDFMVLKKMCAP